jgi:hypothetical protein
MSLPIFWRDILPPSLGKKRKQGMVRNSMDTVRARTVTRAPSRENSVKKIWPLEGTAM